MDPGALTSDPEEPVIRKKVCLLGAPGVGKSSLVRRFVHSLFSDTYVSTIGVKIERKSVLLPGGGEMAMILWDIHGEAGPLKIPDRFLRGTSGFLLVVDATRPETITTAIELRQRVQQPNISLPHVVAWNKTDLIDDRAVADSSRAQELMEPAGATIWTSAKTGNQVDEAFTQLAIAMTTET